MSTQQTAGAADRAAQSDTLENLARIGLVALGVIHVLIGWLAFQLAWFGGGESADQSGALSTLADTPVGKPLLWVLGIGLFALALWQAAEVLRWRHGLSSSGKQRRTAIGNVVTSVAKAILYIGLGVLALRAATGGGQSSEQSTNKTAQGVMGLPAGQFLVAAIGLVIVGIGVYHVYKGWTKKFLEEIDTWQASPSARRWIERSGQVGYPAKGVALMVVGALFVYAAVTFDPEKAAGLDSALRTVLDAPFGKFLLTLIALGLVAFGVFCFARARYPQRS